MIGSGRQVPKIIKNPFVEKVKVQAGIENNSSAFAWLLSGYHGSKNMFADTVNATDEKELDEAWLLIAPSDQVRHSLAAITARGLDIAEDYKTLATE